MNENTYRQIVILAAAGFLAFIVWYLSAQVKFARSKVERRMKKIMETDDVSLFDKWGEKYLKRFNSLAIQHNLRWAQRGGFFDTWTVSGVLMRCVIYGLGAYFLFVRSSGISLTTLAVTIGAACLPIIKVRGEAENVRRQVGRMLPEVAMLIAVEMRAGSSMDTAVARVAEMPTVAGKLFREALAEQSRANRPLWSSGAAIGVFLDYMNAQAASGMPQLRRFARQLDRVSSKGVDAPKVIAKVADGFSREYKAQITKAAATLDTKLVFPTMLFFFIPFILAIGLPLFMSVMSAF
jgi:hypothetical protein